MNRKLLRAEQAVQHLKSTLNEDFGGHVHCNLFHPPDVLIHTTSAHANRWQSRHLSTTARSAPCCQAATIKISTSQIPPGLWRLHQTDSKVFMLGAPCC